MKINLYKVIIDLCFKKFVRILKSEVWINNLLNSLLKTNPDTLIIINPKASGGKYENDIE
jgi:hypothetical protein